MEAPPRAQALSAMYVTGPGAGEEQPPGPGQQDDEGEAAQGDGGQPGQDAQHVVGEEGEQEGQGEEDGGLGPDELLVFFRKAAAKSRPRARAREKVSRDPPVTAPKVSRKAGQAPKSSPPAAATMLLGMGASTTDRSWTRRKHRWA